MSTLLTRWGKVFGYNVYFTGFGWHWSGWQGDIFQTRFIGFLGLTRVRLPEGIKEDG